MDLNQNHKQCEVAGELNQMDIKSLLRVSRVLIYVLHNWLFYKFRLFAVDGIGPASVLLSSDSSKSNRFQFYWQVNKFNIFQLLEFVQNVSDEYSDYPMKRRRK